MVFEIDNDTWSIEIKDKQTMLSKLNEDRPEEDRYTYAFGVCMYPKHEIWINEDACKEQVLSWYDSKLGNRSIIVCKQLELLNYG